MPSKTPPLVALAVGGFGGLIAFRRCGQDGGLHVLERPDTLAEVGERESLQHPAREVLGHLLAREVRGQIPEDVLFSV